MYKTNGKVMTELDFEEHVRKKATAYFSDAEYLQKYADNMLRYMFDCYLAGYSQAVKERPREWQNGFDAAMEQFEKHQQLKKGSSDESQK